LSIRERCRVRPSLAAVSVFTGFIVASAALARAEDYAVIFGEKYAEAEQFLRQNAWIDGALRLPPDETRIALAVVFPEIIRFSALEDAIQVRSLKVLYVQYGRAYMNFSVGRFQMKPSFVENLESDYQLLFSAEERSVVGIPAFDRGDTSELREKRVLRLDDLIWQVRYLRLFMLVMKKRYGRVAFAGVEDRLRFYATAFNAGYASGEKALRRMMNERRFHTALFFPKKTYNYADVAMFFFRRQWGNSGDRPHNPIIR
jgi:hypothetical protein